jgi:aspartate/methionine/tyrosine aminotransferase
MTDAAFQPARRTDWDRTPNRLSAAVAAKRRSGRPVIDLTVSNPTACGIEFPDAALREALAAPGALSYDPHPRGLPEARQAVAADYARRGCAIPPDHLLLTSGTSEAYVHLFRLLVEPGEAVLVARPGYPLLDFLARICDVELRPYRLRYRNGWSIDMDSVRAAAGEGAKAVVVVHPNNPTGSFVTEGEREALADLCRKRVMALISDEVFADYVFEPGAGAVRVSTFASERDVLTFILGGLSKSAGLPGLKLSWIAAAGPRAARDEAMSRLELMADTFLSVGTPVQRALPGILELSKPVRDQILHRIRANRKTLTASLGKRLLDVDGGWYGVLRAGGGRTDEDIALDLLNRHAVLVQPGYFYDFDEEVVVVSLLTAVEEFTEGVRLIKAALK